MKLEEKIQTDVTQEMENITKLWSSLELKKRQLEHELSQLNLIWPHMLLDVARGGQSVEVREHTRNRMRQIQDEISDIPLIFEVLQSENSKAQVRLNKIGHLKRKREHYENLKEKISDEPSPSRIEDLRTYASILNEEKDCEEFLFDIESKIKT